MALEKRIYSPWAFTENEREKAKINFEIYKEIKDKAEVKWVRSLHGRQEYEVVSNPHNLNDDELALICDGGNLCYGYRTKGDLIVIYTD